MPQGNFVEWLLDSNICQHAHTDIQHTTVVATKCVRFIFLMQVIPLCADKSWSSVLPIVWEGHCCSPAMGSFYSENVVLYLSCFPKDFHLGHALFNFFAALWYLQSSWHYKWLYTEPFCSGEMYASAWQVSVNYWTDGGIHTLSVVAILSLNPG